jgi:hypothetical protein
VRLIERGAVGDMYLPGKGTEGDLLHHINSNSNRLCNCCGAPASAQVAVPHAYHHVAQWLQRRVSPY